MYQLIQITVCVDVMLPGSIRREPETKFVAIQSVIHLYCRQSKFCPHIIVGKKRGTRHDKIGKPSSESTISNDDY